jgi:hypothetical protein
MMRFNALTVGIIALLSTTCSEKKSTEPEQFYSILGEFNDESPLQSAFVADDIAYLTRSDSRISIVDISNPTDPVFAASFEISDSDCEIYVESGYCYLIYFFNGLMQIFDVTDPYDPVLAGDYQGLSWPQDVSVYNGYAYMVGNNEGGDSNGLYIVNVEDPQNPNLETTVNLPYSYFTISISFEYAYINGCRYGGPLQPDTGEFCIIDISNPIDPILVGSLNDMTRIGDIFISDDRAYLARNVGNLYIIDVSDSADPIMMGVYNHPISLEGVEVFRAYAFCEDWQNTFAINISDPHNPYRDSNYALPYYGMTRCSDNYFLVLDGMTVYIIEITI